MLQRLDQYSSWFFVENDKKVSGFDLADISSFSISVQKSYDKREVQLVTREGEELTVPINIPENELLSALISVER